MNHVRRLIPAGLLAVLFSACGKPTPEPPVVTPPSGTETISGNERIGWDQRAGDNVELATIRYAMYVDGTRNELTGLSCASAATSVGYACTAPLPRMSAGPHTLEIASFIQDGSVLESARSAALRVNVTGVITPADGRSMTRTVAWPRGVQAVVTGLQQPSDLAVAPDGRVFVAEHTGRIRVVDERQRLLDEPAIAFDRSTGAGDVLAVALDPDFDRTHFVFAVVTGRVRSGATGFVLARLRESGNTLGDMVVLVDGVPASAEPKAVLRIGLDRKVYAAFDDGGDPRAAQDPGSLNGKLVRLNPDGTTPLDQRNASPIAAAGYLSPRGLAWHRPTARLWSADALRIGTRTWTPEPVAIAIAGDGLFVASADGMARATIDPQAPDGLSPVTRVTRGEPITSVAAAPNGRVYFTTASTLGVVTDAYK